MSVETSVTLVTQPVQQTNVTFVTHQSPPPSVPVVTSPALRFQYPLLNPLGIFTFPQGVVEILLRIVICVRKE